MAIVLCDVSVSLDGYVAGPNDSRANPFGDGAHTLHAWLSEEATDADRSHCYAITSTAPARS